MGEFAPFPRDFYRRAVLQLWQEFATYARGKCEQTKPRNGPKSAENQQRAYSGFITFLQLRPPSPPLTPHEG